jgi:hypothetical protein
MGGVAALLASTLAISNAAEAINLTVSNTTATGTAGFTNTGQSFVNDPSGNGTAILLNDWTFAFLTGNIATAAGETLNIYAGTGNGGLLKGSSNITAITTLNGFSAVTWTFAGGLSLIDKDTYTANINTANALNFQFSSGTPYLNGVLTSDAVPVSSLDTTFQGNFSSATAVPFEFEPTGGLMVVGGVWLLRRHLKKKKETKV